ncbi:formylglycine-generating enzyme family protein [Glaesserella sp.]|uniref:formylglycine-generating enzyme family protein n=1 Tax=Glaesserella sp. TaxID=2094731 RepID=UPI00359F1CCE
MKHKFYYSALTSFLFLSAAQVGMAETWDKKFYNPKELDNDVILPMPCDGAMVFRVVKTGTRLPLEDKSIVLGSEAGEQKFAEYATPNYIAGSFTEQGGERYFLMGKYEVSQLQYQAVMNETCPKAEMKARFPVTDISWFDAVAFSNKYSEWLLKNHPNVLPKEDNKAGFVRLPTNAEWEYATRGGASVSESEFREKVFPMPEGNMTKAVWSSKNANGKLQLTGQLDGSNPLGLFDMLGNANEMTFDAFKANKLDRYHGLSGGITVRGGSYLTSEEQISSAFRTEQPYYTESGQPFKAKDTGFRIAFVSTLITSSNRMKAISEEWQQLGKDSKEDQELVNNLGKLAESVENQELKNKLKELEDALRASNQQKDEQRDHAIRSALQLGAFLCTDIQNIHNQFLDNKDRQEYACTAKLESCDSWTERTQLSQAERDFVLKYYADSVVETANTYNKENVEKQVAHTIDKLKNQQKNNVDKYINLYWNHLSTYYNNGKVERNNWLNACTQ